MTKFFLKKNKGDKNYYKKFKILKEELQLRQNIFTDCICRLTKEVSRDLNKNYQSESQEVLIQAKRKIGELSLIATQDSFKAFAERCHKSSQFEFLINEINRISERRSKKKCQIIALVNYVRRIIKGIELSNEMNNIQDVKE